MAKARPKSRRCSCEWLIVRQKGASLSLCTKHSICHGANLILAKGGRFARRAFVRRGGQTCRRAGNASPARLSRARRAWPASATDLVGQSLRLPKRRPGERAAMVGEAPRLPSRGREARGDPAGWKPAPRRSCRPSPFLPCSKDHEDFILPRARVGFRLHPARSVARGPRG
jgi:hypothetical protein